MFSWTEARAKNDAAGKCHFYFSGYQYLEPHFFIGRPLVALFSVQKFLDLQFLFCRLCIVQFLCACVRARLFWRPSPSSNNGANIFIKPLNVEYQSEWTIPDSDISIVRRWPFDRHSILRDCLILVCVIIWPSFMRIEYAACLSAMAAATTRTTRLQ